MSLGEEQDDYMSKEGIKGISLVSSDVSNTVHGEMRDEAVTLIGGHLAESFSDNCVPVASASGDTEAKHASDTTATKINCLLEVLLRTTVIPPNQRRSESQILHPNYSPGAAPLIKSLVSLPVQPKELYFIEGLSRELRDEDANLRLSFDNIERVVFARVEDAMNALNVSTSANKFCTTTDCSSPEDILAWLAACRSRFTTEYIEAYPALSLLYQQIGPSLINTHLHSIRELLTRHAALMFVCPEVFSAQPPTPTKTHDMIKKLYNLGSALSSRFFPSFLGYLEEGGSGGATVERVFAGIFEDITEALADRTLLDTKPGEVNFLSFLLQHKSLAALCVKQPGFYPVNSQQPILFFSAAPGWTLQNQSLLGHILQPTVLDNPILKPGTESVRVKYFGKSSHSMHSGHALKAVRDDLHGISEVATGILKNLCKADRNAVLLWLGGILEANAGRAMMASEVSFSAAVSAMPQMEALTLKANGFCSNGFALNVFWALLKLCEPVKLNKISDLEPFLALREDSKTQQIIGRMHTDSKLGNEEEIKRARDFFGISSTSSSLSEPKFSSLIFWLTVKGCATLLGPALVEFEHLVRKIRKLHDTPHSGGGQNTLLEAAYIDYQIWTAVLYHPKLLSSWWYFCHLACCFYLRCAYVYTVSGDECPEVKQFIDNKLKNLAAQTTHSDAGYRHIYSSLVCQWINPPSISRQSSTNSTATKSQLPPQLAALPSTFIEDLVNGIKFHISSASEMLYQSLDVELVFATALFTLANTAYIRNPHTRWSSAAKTLYILLTNENLKARVETSELSLTHLIPTIVEAYIDAQQVGFYGRIEQRLLYVQLLERIFQQRDIYKKRLDKFSRDQNESFLKFINSFIGNTSWVLEEGMSFLAEIKKRQTRQQSTHSTTSATASTPELGNTDFNTSGQLRSSSDSQDVEQRQRDDAADASTEHNVEEMPLADLERICKDLMDGGERSIRVFAMICEQTGTSITKSDMILPQVITSLNSCLYSLVGPKCLQLRVSNFSQYNFNPRELLAKLCDCYISLSGLVSTPPTSDKRFNWTDSDETKLLLNAICSEGRYFKPAIFRKALDIGRREGLLSLKATDCFGFLARRLNEVCAERQQQVDFFDDLGDEIPEEYLDPIMQELMDDPVRLNTSGQIMDRRHIERHLMDEEFDPFSRCPLHKDDLQAVPELKARIVDWIAEMKAKKGMQ